MKKTYAWANLIVIIILIIWNYVANSAGIKGNTVSSLSNEYQNLFTPASYAFAIWGLIYIALLAHGIYQVKKAVFDKTEDGFIVEIGPWLIIANLANGSWLLTWLLEYTGLSVLIMFVLLASLIIIIVKLNMERFSAPIGIIAFVWWPLSLYSGWITVATIANVASWLSKLEWQVLFSEVTWTITMIIIAAAIYLFMIVTRNMREYAFAGIWALIAISVRHWDSIPILQWTGMVSAIILIAAVIIHGYINRNSNEIVSWFKAKT